MGTESRKAGVRIFRLGDEPRDDLRDSTTIDERLEILRDLTERAWTLTGCAFPSYAREEIPVRIVPLE